MKMYSSLTIAFVLLFIFSYIAQAIVPDSNTFKVVNFGTYYGLLEGGSGYYVDVELVPDQRFKKLSNYPFNLCFYSPKDRFITPFTFNLAVRLDNRLVWLAKQTELVGINATLTFGPGGNLVLADSDGRRVWETGTTNMGVVDINLLPNGNVVLVGDQGEFVWQSFHFPTDVLVSGQSLRANGVNKLVSRRSPADPHPGSYSLVMNKNGMNFYYKSSSMPGAKIYSQMESDPGRIPNMTEFGFESHLARDEPAIFELALKVTYGENNSFSGSPFWTQPKFNATYSFARIDADGNFRYYTYFDNIRDKMNRENWEVTHTLFARSGFVESECKLPQRCGAFRVCQSNQCVACPSPNGLLGWSESCAPPRLPPCSVNGTYTTVTYYEVVGVDHYSSKYSSVPMSLVDCREKCTRDCKCKGFFYKTRESRCLIPYELNTLTKVSDSTHLAYIKIAS